MTLFLYMLRASMLSTGGFGNVSGLHNALVPRGWATDPQFVQALTVGQLSPGPNGLWVISLGYLMLGPWGAIAALIAILIPPFLVIGVEKLYSRVQNHPAVEGLIRGLMLAVIGTVITVLAQLLISSGSGAFEWALAAIALSLGCIPRIPVVAIMAFCGVIGLIVHR